MGRISKLKRDHIRKTNELLEAGGGTIQRRDTVPLKSSANITGSSQKFINKMNNLKEEGITPGTHPDLFYDDDFRKMKEKYSVKSELNPTQKQLHDGIMSQIGQTFASWMSPKNPAFSQEYAKGPYWDNLSTKIRDIIINSVE